MGKYRTGIKLLRSLVLAFDRVGAIETGRFLPPFLFSSIAPLRNSDSGFQKQLGGCQGQQQCPLFPVVGSGHTEENRWLFLEAILREIPHPHSGFSTAASSGAAML